MTRTERTYYLVFALYNFSWSFIGPMYALFLLDRGLDLFQMSAVPAVYWIVSFVFEVPTGAFADLAGRKTAFLLSCVIRMVAFALYAYAGGFRDFVVAEFIDALGSTLANGALDAWAVDGMQGEGDARPADRFFARAQMVARTAIIAGGVACFGGDTGSDGAGFLDLGRTSAAGCWNRPRTERDILETGTTFSPTRPRGEDSSKSLCFRRFGRSHLAAQFLRVLTVRGGSPERNFTARIELGIMKEHRAADLLRARRPGGIRYGLR